MAPASTQSSASDLMEINIWGSVETCALNILPFLSFQIRQQTKANSVSKPFCQLPGSNALNSSHLSMMEHAILGSDRLTPRVAKIACQTCKVTEQEANKWSLVSGSWSQRRQFEYAGMNMQHWTDHVRPASLTSQKAGNAYGREKVVIRWEEGGRIIGD